MKKYYLLCEFFLMVFSVMICSRAKAQIIFQKSYGGNNIENSYSIQKTTDGGFVISGDAGSFGAGGADAYLIKIDSSGSLLWSKTFGGSANDYAYAVQQTTDGGYIITGSTASFGAGNDDVYLIKTDSTGNTLWNITWGGSKFEVGEAVQQTTDGGFIVTGYTNSFSMLGSGDAYLIKVDSGGSILWSKIFGGSSGNDYGFSIQQAVDGGFIIAGMTNSFGSGIYYDVCLFKTDSNGNLLWAKNFGGSNDDSGLSVQETTDGGFVITGVAKSFSAGNYDVYLLKTDSSGSLLWSKTFGGSDTDQGNSVNQTTDGGFVVAGMTKSFGAGGYDAYLVKTDSTGNPLWTKTFGRSAWELGYSVLQANDGGFIVAGDTDTPVNLFGNIYVIKTDSNGNSGCDEGNPNTIVTTPSTIEANLATQVSSGGVMGNPATQTASGGIGITICSGVVGEDEIAQEEVISIYPNPTSGVFELRIANLACLPAGCQNCGLKVCNVLGETIYQSEIHNPKSEIDLSEAPSGIYFVKVKTPDGVGVKKIIKE